MFVAAFADRAGHVPQLRTQLTRAFGGARWRHVYAISTASPLLSSHDLSLHQRHHYHHQQQQVYEQTGAINDCFNKSMQYIAAH